jgi:hypothetical protein
MPQYPQKRKFLKHENDGYDIMAIYLFLTKSSITQIGGGIDKGNYYNNNESTR